MLVNRLLGWTRSVVDGLWLGDFAGYDDCVVVLLQRVAFRYRERIGKHVGGFTAALAPDFVRCRGGPRSRRDRPGWPRAGFHV